MEGTKPKVETVNVYELIDKHLDRLKKCSDPSKFDPEDLAFIKSQTSRKANGNETNRIIAYIHEKGFTKICENVFVSVHSDQSGTGFMQAGDSPDRAKLIHALVYLWNATDKLVEVCKCVCLETSIIKIIFNDLGNSRIDQSSNDGRYIIKGYLGILHNSIRLFNDGASLYRSLDAVNILQRCSKSTYLIIKAKCLITLAYIINEEESAYVNASKESITFIVKILEDALKNDNHIANRYAFSAEELASGLNKMAMNDRNKAFLIEAGVLPLLIQLLSNTCTEAEQFEASRCLWTLSFCKDELARSLLTTDTKLRQVLEGLKKSSSVRVKHCVNGVLWEISDSSRRQQSITSSLEKKSVKRHLMISYSWSVKEIVRPLAEALKSKGFSVWIDYDRLHGSILEAMADAVEQASVVLVCISKKYKESNPCRTEAEYAYRLNKHVIPVLCEKHYVPDGWLGALLGTKKYFDFARSDALAEAFPDLVAEIAKFSSEEQKNTSCATTNNNNNNNNAIPAIQEKRQISYRSWGVEQVDKWAIESHCKSEHIDKILNGLDGELLYELREMLSTAPEAFYSTLKMEGCFLKETLLFTKALRSLSRS